MKNARTGLFLLGMIALRGFAFGDDLPAFKQGLWEFTRTVAGAGENAKSATMTNQKCMDPNQDMLSQNEMLKKMGCTVSPAKKVGNTYTFAADCGTRPRDGHAVSNKSTSAITAKSDSAYSVTVTGMSGDKITTETLEAKRIGDCPK